MSKQNLNEEEKKNPKDSQQSQEETSTSSSENEKDFLEEDENQEDENSPKDDSDSDDDSSDDAGGDDDSDNSEEDTDFVGEEDKSKEDEKSSDDEGYDIDFGDDTSLSEKDQDLVAETIGELGLKKEQAEKLVASLNKLSIGSLAGEAAKIQKKSEEERNAFLSDKNWSTAEARKESGRLVNEVIKKFGSEDLRNLLKSPDFNNVHVFNTLRKLGEAMKDDTFHGKGANTSSKEPDMLERMYPEFYSEK